MFERVQINRHEGHDIKPNGGIIKNIIIILTLYTCDKSYIEWIWKRMNI